MSVPQDENVIAKLSNEFATVWLELDEGEANGCRLRIRSLRDHEDITLDPVALSLLCQLDQDLLSLLADIARDSHSREEFQRWFHARYSPPGASADP